MGVGDLQTFLESESLEGGSVSVDLLKIARNVLQRQQPHNTNRKIRPIPNKLKLIVDAENCLDRLYGGYFSDWVCGGQWNRMVQFLSLLSGALERGNIELAVVFNGTIEQCRMNEWLAEQANVRQRVGMVLKHVNMKATPPPKIWWTPPTCLRTALRMALRHLGVTVMCTMDDHHQEVIAYCREYGFHGLLADDAEYAAFDPPRYFSSEHLKLTYKGSIETKEYMLSVLTKNLSITQEQMCVMAALLGNFLLPESDLQDFYKKINITRSSAENNVETYIKTLADFVKSLPPPRDMDNLVVAVLGSLDDKRASRLRQSIYYYLNGTANGFLKYCISGKPKQKQQKETSSNSKLPKDEDLNISGFASETREQEEESLEKYKLVMANSIAVNDLENNEDLLQCHTEDLTLPNTNNGVLNGSIAASSSSDPKTTHLAVGCSSSAAEGASPKLCNKGQGSVVAPAVSADVLRTASLRHQKGLMAPTILHVLSTQEVRLPCLMEVEGNREFPPIHEVYLQLRKRVYAVLFNLHHLRYGHSKQKENGDVPETARPPDVVVREWAYTRANPYQRAEEVKAEPLPWAVPTLQRLWFGPSLDDKRRRMRALLSCLNSDTPLILNTTYVPQHMLIMACVLRYVMSQDRPIVRRNELDAFLCQAFNPNLMNPQYLQDLTLNVVTTRGAQLAALFMQGVEMAVLANDACGAPLPWLMCCPWLYFDGKLFHYTLARTAHAKNVLEVCDNYIERVVKVERMKKAILEGLEFKYAKVPLPPFAGAPMLRPHCVPAVPMQARGGPRNVAAARGRPVPARGGQLQVAGVVVGSWGANYGYNHHQHQQHHGGAGLSQTGGLLPAGMPYGTRGRGGYNNYGRGRGRKQGPPTYPVNARKNQAGKKRNTNKSNKEKNPKGLVLTVKTDDGDVPVSEILDDDDDDGNSPGGSRRPSSGDRKKGQPAVDHKGQGDAPSGPIEAVVSE